MSIFKIGKAVAANDATIRLSIPPSGVVVTQATIMGLLPNGDAANVTIRQCRVIDRIDVERYVGPNIPGKISGLSTLEIDVSCEHAVAIAIVLLCTPRKATLAEVDTDVDVEVGSGDPE